MSKILSLIIRIFIVVILIAGGFLVYQTCAGGHIVEKIDKTLPDSIVAPFEVFTATRIYYAQSAILHDDGSAEMKNWYENINQKWIYHEEKIVLPRALHPRISKR